MAGIALRCAAALIFAGGPAMAADLTISVTGAGAGGAIRAMVFRDARSFDARENAVAAVAIQPHDGQAQFTVAELPAGTYAVAAFQDVNGNQVIDANWLGIPAEPYGFSNDARGSRPPDFSRAAVHMDENGLRLVIRLK